MPTSTSPIITEDLYEFLESSILEIEDQDDHAKETVASFILSLKAAAEGLSDRALAEEVLDALAPALSWVEEGTPNFEEPDGDEDSAADEQLLAPLESACALLGDLLVPIGANGYDSNLEFGRLSAEQIAPYEEIVARVSFDGQDYGFTTIPEHTR